MLTHSPVYLITVNPLPHISNVCGLTGLNSASTNISRCVTSGGHRTTPPTFELVSLPPYNIGIQPCGHSAREKGIQVKVFASCQPDQVPSSLMYSARGCENDKNTGHPTVSTDKEISPGQTTCSIDCTRITCGKFWDEKCAGLTFHRLREIFIGEGIKVGRKAWCYVIIVDDPKTICKFKGECQGQLRETQDVEMSTV